MVSDYYPELGSPQIHSLSGEETETPLAPLETQNRMSVGFAGELIHALHHFRQVTRRDVHNDELSEFFKRRIYTTEEDLDEDEFTVFNRPTHMGLKPAYGRVWKQVDRAIEDSVPIIRERVEDQSATELARCLRGYACQDNEIE